MKKYLSLLAVLVLASPAFAANTYQAGTGSVAPGAQNNLGYYSAAGSTVTGLSNGTGVLSQSSGGVPSWTSAPTVATQPSYYSGTSAVNGATLQAAIYLSMSLTPLNVSNDTVGTISFSSVGAPYAILYVNTVSNGAITGASVLGAGGSMSCRMASNTALNCAS